MPVTMREQLYQFDVDQVLAGGRHFKCRPAVERSIGMVPDSMKRYGVPATFGLERNRQHRRTGDVARLAEARDDAQLNGVGSSVKNDRNR